MVEEKHRGDKAKAQLKEGLASWANQIRGKVSGALAGVTLPPAVQNKIDEVFNSAESEAEDHAFDMVEGVQRAETQSGGSQ
jgi:hypothetical protein